LVKLLIRYSFVNLIALLLLLSVGSAPAIGDDEYVKLDESRAVTLMLNEINRMRANEGLGPLILSPELSAVSRRHSKDMADRDYFGHLDPDGLDANDRVRQAGLNCIVSENIGVYRTDRIPMARVISDLMDSFYKSELHRANILNPHLTHVGIGFYQNAYGATSIFSDDENRAENKGYGVIFVTQDFFRLEIADTEPSALPAKVPAGQEVELKIRTVNDFDFLSLHFERDGFFTEEYLVQLAPDDLREYSCTVRFAQRGRWACHVSGIYDQVQGLSRGIGQMEFEVQ
jgi:hypothetical protein